MSMSIRSSPTTLNSSLPMRNSSPPIINPSPSTLDSSPPALKPSQPSPLVFHPPAETWANGGPSQYDKPGDNYAPEFHAAWILNFISSHKDSLSLQIAFHTKEFERSRAHAAAQQQCMQSAYEQLTAFDRFEAACTASIRSHGIDVRSIAPVSTRVPLPNWYGPAFAQ